MIRSNSAGTARFTLEGGAGWRVSSASNAAIDVAPVNGSVPVAISYSTMPNEKTSARASSSSPRACSGDMYATVPSVVPTVVTCSGATRVTSASPPPRRDIASLAMPKSSTLAWPRSGDEDIRRLDVAMNDAAGVRGVEAIRDFDAELEDTVERQRSARDLVLQRPAIEQLHDDEPLGAVLADVVDGADVWMVERRGDAGLALEPIQRLGIAGQIGRQELQRDLAAQTHVFGAIDDAHAAGAEALENLVMADNGPNHGCTRIVQRLGLGQPKPRAPSPQPSFWFKVCA